MKKFYCQESRSIKEFDEYMVAKMYIEVPEKYTYHFIKDLDKKMAEFVSEYKPTDTPIVFILGRSFNGEKRSLSVDLFLSMAGIFVSHLFTNEATEGEARLSVPKNLSHIKFSELTKKSLVDRKLLFPNFTIELMDDKEEKVICSVME